jgi:hypothetical protein
MQVRPLGVVHAQTFHYIRFLQHPVCSLCYDGLLAMVHHRGGDACSEHLVGHGGPG